MSKWIKVSERLPTGSRDVLVALETGAVRTAFYDGKKGKWLILTLIGPAHLYTPTHWRHMVMPPREVGS